MEAASTPSQHSSKTILDWIWGLAKLKLPPSFFLGRAKKTNGPSTLSNLLSPLITYIYSVGPIKTISSRRGRAPFTIRICFFCLFCSFQLPIMLGFPCSILISPWMTYPNAGKNISLKLNLLKLDWEMRWRISGSHIPVSEFAKISLYLRRGFSFLSHKKIAKRRFKPLTRFYLSITDVKATKS